MPVADDRFPIDFLGQTIECESLADAATIKTVRDMLLGHDPTPYKAQTLDDFARVLERYDLASAAQVIRDWYLRRD
jgi:hypothetical protein